MSRFLNKLPNSRREPHGLEWKILKKMPMATLASLVIPGLMVLYARMSPMPAPGESVDKYLTGINIAAIATSVTALTAVFTVAIGCVIVVLMKGPAYVADEYPLSDASEPRDDKNAEEEPDD